MKNDKRPFPRNPAPRRHVADGRLRLAIVGLAREQERLLGKPDRLRSKYARSMGVRSLVPSARVSPPPARIFLVHVAAHRGGSSVQVVEYRGLWWRPADTKKRVAGVLTFRSGHRPTLELLGSFFDPAETLNRMLGFYVEPVLLGDCCPARFGRQ